MTRRIGKHKHSMPSLGSVLIETEEEHLYSTNKDGSIYEVAKGNTAQGTPNPWYHHQKRKLLLRYQKQLLEQSYDEEEQLSE